jgi:alpha-1,2-mannosyltransferase
LRQEESLRPLPEPARAFAPFQQVGWRLEFTRMNMGSRISSWIEVLQGLPEARTLRLALFVWAVYAAIIAGIVAVQPDRRTVTPEYREACEEWWGAQDIYEVRMHGYLYLPHAAILYTPFAALPVRVGEPLWRLVSLGLLAWSIWRLSKTFGGGRAGLWFLIATVSALPASFSSARNGQMNLTMAALLAMAAMDLGIRAWNRASLSLLLSFALKPLGIVPCLLAGGCYIRPMVWRLALGAVLLGAVSFVHWKPGFVASQYELFVQTMQIAGKPKQPLFCDIQGMLLFFGTPLPDPLMTAVRVLAALGTLVVACLAMRRYDPARGAFTCMLLAVWYLLLFNPRTETNSYVLLAPYVGILVAASLQEAKFLMRFVALVALALILSCENWGPLHKLTNLWFKAAACSVFGGFLIRDVWTGRNPMGLPTPPEKQNTAL